MMSSTAVLSAPQANVDKARAALAKKKGDASSTKQLEQVFQAAEKNYSMLKKGKQALTYSVDYTYFADQRLDLQIVNNSVKNLDVTPSATHTITNSFSYDYGLLNNVTLSTRVPFVSKYDTQRGLSNNSIGDVSLSLRWQPNPYVPGKVSVTTFASLGTKTGVSPYEIDINRELSSGSGTWSVSAGASANKVLDPAVLYGSVSASYNLPAKKLNQVRGGRLLREVDPGYGLSFSGGFSFALSYDLSISLSTQLSYSNKTTLSFSDGSSAIAKDQMSALVNMSLGARISEKTIMNINFGFGLTADSPGVLLGLSLPINLDGLKK
jgi:hypothetical protein